MLIEKKYFEKGKKLEHAQIHKYSCDNHHLLTLILYIHFPIWLTSKIFIIRIFISLLIDNIHVKKKFALYHSADVTNTVFL